MYQCAPGASVSSVSIHRQCYEFLTLAVSTWERPIVEKAAGLVEDLLRKGLVDADAASRRHCRR